jgi:hypothetical protein
MAERKSHKTTAALRPLKAIKQYMAAHTSALPRAALLSVLALSAASYSASCMAIYRRTPEITAMFSMLCILLVISESWWNNLGVTPAERLMVCALTCRALRQTNMPTTPKDMEV